MKPMHTLGISCSTRILAVCVCYSNQLIDYAIMLDKAAWTNAKRDKIMAIVQQYCSQHHITDIALVIPQLWYQTDESKELMDAILKLAYESGIKVTPYPLQDIYRAFGNRAVPTRASLIRRIAMLYHELERYESKELTNKNKYYIKLFEAVAGASIHVLAAQETQG